MFKTELHMHSKEVSYCCDTPTKETAARYIEAGYTTVTLTDHYGPYINNLYTDTKERVDFFMQGYYSLCRELEGKINVLFGFELCLEESNNDYLVYGLGEDFLRDNPSLVKLPRPEAVELIHSAGGLVYHAHPFRQRMTVMSPVGLDGIEIFNSHNTQNSRNYLAKAFAENEGLPGIAGSDFHHPYHWPSAGILTEKEIRTEADLLDALRSGSYQVFGEIIPKEQVLAEHPYEDKSDK